MDRLRPINTIADATTAGQNVALEGPAQVKALYYMYTADNAATKDTDHDDITGNMVIQVMGDKLPTGNRVSVSRVQSFVSLCDVIKGRCRTNSTTGGDALHTLKVPFGMDGDDNCLFIRRGQRLVAYVPQFDDTDVDSCSCTVYAELAPSSVSRYNMIHLDEQVTLGGLRRITLSREGLMGLVLSEGSSSNPDSFAIMAGDERLLWGDWDDFRGVFQTAGHVEGDMIYADQVADLTNLGRALWQGIQDDLVLELQGGTGTLNVHQVIQDRHVGGALQESIAYRAGQVTSARIKLEASGEPREISKALVPVPSLSPEIVSPGMPQPKAESIPRRTALPVVEKKRPRASVLKTFS